VTKKHLNIPLEEDKYERVRAVKDTFGLTWPEFVEEVVAVGELAAETRDDGYTPLSVVVRERFEAAEGRTEAVAEHQRARTPTAAPQEPAPAEKPEEGVTDAHREHLREELPGEGETLEARVDAILAMYGHLRKEGEGEKGDFLALVDLDTVRYDSRESVWSNTVKGKDTLASLPGVEKPDTGLTTWRYRP